MKARPKDSKQLYGQLVHAHSKELYRFAYRLCGRDDTAEDLVQETFCEAWRSIRKLEDPTKARAWLYQILRHRHSHWLRDSRRRIQPSTTLDDVRSELHDPKANPLDSLSRKEILQQALDQLEERYKVPFLMVFMEGKTCKEVAADLDIPLGTVLSRIHRARSFLRQSLRELEAEPPPNRSEEARRRQEDDDGIRPFRMGGQA